MQATEVDITFVKPKDGLIALATVVLNDQLYLSGIAIHSKLVGSGYRLTYPARKVGEAQFSVFHPIRKQVGLAIEDMAAPARTGAVMTDYGRLRGRDCILMDRAPEATVEALMYSLRRGINELTSPDAKRRLSELSEDQLRAVCERLRNFKPEIAPAWTPEEVEALTVIWSELK
jgi:DNA-binding cell septation regulator SpoVG